jgi:hypothetical protein
MKDLWTAFFVAVGGLVATIASVAILGLVIGWLLAIMWNFAMPSLFGLPEATWSQMFVLFVMIRLIFGTGQSKVVKRED